MGLVGRGQDSVVDDEAFGVAPLGRRLGRRVDDHVTAEHRRPPADQRRGTVSRPGRGFGPAGWGRGRGRRRSTARRSTARLRLAPALLDIGRALVGTAAVHAVDHPADPTEGVRAPTRCVTSA